MNGFILIAKTNKGKKGVLECMKANLIKEKLSDDPLKVKFLFTRTQFKERRFIDEKELYFFLDHMFKSFIGERNVDYDVEVVV